MQLLKQPEPADNLPPGFVDMTEESSTFSINGTLQILDDCAPSLIFEKANIFSGKNIRMGRERIIRNIVLPYRAIRSSRSFTLYERID